MNARDQWICGTGCVEDGVEVVDRSASDGYSHIIMNQLEVTVPAELGDFIEEQR